ncbi:MAG TPA: hypothetical protein VG013_15580, partial [Gemmataceae bacterium]|nr:hypothetical protein [Gemmataceae bacterium]
MTILGKILVIVNLVFSLVVGAFIVLFFAKQTNWREASEKWHRYADVAEADARTAVAETEEALKQKDRDVAKVTDDLKKAQAARDALDKQVKAAEEDLVKAKAEAAGAGNNTMAYLAEVDRRSKEVKTYKDLLDARDRRLVELQKNFEKANEDRLAAEIAFKSELQHAKALLDDNDRLARLVEEQKSRGGTGTGGPRIETVAKPPPEDVEGIVEESDPKTGLVTISIGSDSGVTKGNTLEVYRYKPRPDYVGMIRIVDSRPHQ